jgi:hypothetical protein
MLVMGLIAQVPGADRMACFRASAIQTFNEFR